MDIPLLLRIMEYSKEDAKSDLDLHKVTENIIKLSKENSILTIDDYNNIVNTSQNNRMQQLAGIVNEEDLSREDRLNQIRSTFANAPLKGGSLSSFSDEEIKKGFKVNPSGEIMYTPKIVHIKTQINKFKKEIRPYMYDTDTRVAELSSALYQAFIRIESALSKLRDLIELKKRNSE
jgi:hypothetical protein